MALLHDALTAAAAGFAGTTAMEQLGTKLKALEWDADQQREQDTRPGPPFVLAARNLSERVLGVTLDEQQQQKAGMALHLLAGIAWAPVYQQLRRRTGLKPATAGLITGASQSLLLDEVITPAIGASAPNRDYPLVTHLRGLAGSPSADRRRRHRARLESHPPTVTEEAPGPEIPPRRGRSCLRTAGLTASDLQGTCWETSVIATVHPGLALRCAEKVCCNLGNQAACARV